MASKGGIPITFVGLGAGDAAPDTALYKLDANGAPVEKLARVENGMLGIDPAKLAGLQVALGPDSADPKTVEPERLLKFRADQVIADWQASGILIPQERWPIFRLETVCVSGTVKKCRPWWYDLIATSPAIRKIGVQRRALPSAATDLSAASILLPQRCVPICDGVVEIYERVCCCTVIDWHDLLGKLYYLLKQVPAEINWPVPPIPDPGPLHGPVFGPVFGPLAGRPPISPVFSPPGGRLLGVPRILPNIIRPLPQLTAKAPRRIDFALPTVSQRIYDDYRALLKTPPDQVSAFVDARPYLSAYICTCTSRKVGETPIHPSGAFDFCYRRLPQILALRTRCYTTFAYRVKQQIGGVWTVIYDGLAGHDYFGQGDIAELHTSNPTALPCGDGPPPPDAGDGTPFVMLEHVGGAGTHHFNTPAQTALSRVGALDANDGLFDFGGIPDCPWATTLGLRLWVSRELEGTVAFYRLKAVAVDATGAPVGVPTILKPTAEQAVSWARFVNSGGDIITVSDSLEVDASTVGGEEGLCRVPYWSGGMNWLSGQFHRYWNTAGASYPDGKYMLLLEVFGPGGVRIKPASAPGGDPGVAQPFQFRAWDTPTHTRNVPFADCAHVFWVNNTPVSGDIADLRKNGVPSTDECQFMSGPGTTTFSAGFRAYHVNGVTTGGGAGDTDSFMAGYALTWQRGLNGPSGTIETGTADKGELAIAQSNTLTFATLLGAFPPTHAAHTRCSFSVHLHVDAKHHNGGAFIDAYDYDETASFALELIGS